jgi:molybdopterin/thiamine biosynthesis adenylyltransferase
MRPRRSGPRAVSATPEPRQRWFEALPDRLDWEIAEFEARGLPVDQYETQSAQLGIKTSLPFRGEEIEIKVVFPFDYPDVEPHVFGPQDLLMRHQDRRYGNFCLLEDPAADWWPGMAAAQLVDEDLRWLLEDSEAGEDAVWAGEADMPEPLSQHLPADRAEVVLVPDPFWEIELNADEGGFVLNEKIFGGHVLGSADSFGEPDARLVDRVTSSDGRPHKGRWCSLPDNTISPWPGKAEVLEAACSTAPELLVRLKRALGQRRKLAAAKGWVAVTFIEEGPTREERRRGWSFMEVEMKRNGDVRVLRMARAQALTDAERKRRIPELVGLGRAGVLVVGAGSVGAPIAIELAKAGVGRINIADHDWYDVNNAVRHVLDLRWAGSEKEIAVTVEARDLNPFVSIAAHHLNVGESAKDSLLLDTILDDVDLVIDATGSQVAARVLQRRCREFGLPMVLAGLTAGSFGGEVAVFRSDRACYYCFVLGQDDGSVPKPMEGPRSNTTPVGCSTPAFSGAGFDATALAALTARTAVQVSGMSAYPPFEDDYLIVNFREEQPLVSGTLPIHPGCPLCL